MCEVSALPGHAPSRKADDISTLRKLRQFNLMTTESAIKVKCHLLLSIMRQSKDLNEPHIVGML